MITADRRTHLTRRADYFYPAAGKPPIKVTGDRRAASVASPRISIRGAGLHRSAARREKAAGGKMRAARGGGGSSGRTDGPVEYHDDPWVMRVLAFLIADDAAKEHAARPLIGGP